MAVFVILALALLAMAVGAVVVAAVQVTRAAKGTRETVETTRGRLQPLAEELQAELAVTSTEVDALGRSMTAFGTERHRRRGRRRGRSKPRGS